MDKTSSMATIPTTDHVTDGTVIDSDTSISHEPGHRWRRL